MIFGIKIFRLDFFVTFFIKEKSKNALNHRPLVTLIVAKPQNHGKDLSAGRRE
jgi:hypothetical protein